MTGDQEDEVDLEQLFGFAEVEDDLGMAEYLAAVYSDADDDDDRAGDRANRAVASTRRLVYMRQRIDVMVSTHSAWRSTGKISENTLRNLEDDIGVAEAQWMRGAMKDESIRLDDPAPTRTPTLNSEEAAYLLALGQGDKPSDIARRRGFTSARPVQVVIQTAREKLGCKTTEQAVLWAYRNGEFAYWREEPAPSRKRNRPKHEIARDRERTAIEKERRRMRREGDFKARGLRGSDDEKAYLHPANGDPAAAKQKQVYAALDDSPSPVEYDGEAEERDEYEAALKASASQSEEVALSVSRAKRSGNE